MLQVSLVNSQIFSIEGGLGAAVSVNKFIHTSDVSPYFNNNPIMDLSAEIGLSVNSLKKTPRSSYGLYVAFIPQWVSAVVKRKGALPVVCGGNWPEAGIEFKKTFFDGVKCLGSYKLSGQARFASKCKDQTNTIITT
jgi:hypothetical protein